MSRTEQMISIQKKMEFKIKVGPCPRHPELWAPASLSERPRLGHVQCHLPGGRPSAPGSPGTHLGPGCPLTDGVQDPTSPLLRGLLAERPSLLRELRD